MRAGTESWRQNRETPWWLVRYLEAAIGEPFALDACALPHNAKAPRWWGPDQDALRQQWSGVEGWIFCNPQFSSKVAILERYATADRACLVLTCSAWESWWHQALNSSDAVWVLRAQRVPFALGPDAPPEERAKPNNPTSGISVFVRGRYAPRHFCVGACGKIHWIDGRAVKATFDPATRDRMDKSELARVLKQSLSSETTTCTSASGARAVAGQKKGGL